MGAVIDIIPDKKLQSRIAQTVIKILYDQNENKHIRAGACECILRGTGVSTIELPDFEEIIDKNYSQCDEKIEDFKKRYLKD